MSFLFIWNRIDNMTFIRFRTFGDHTRFGTKMGEVYTRVGTKNLTLWVAHSQMAFIRDYPR